MYITAQGPVSEMTYTVSSGTLNPSIAYDLVNTSENATNLRLNHISTPVDYTSFSFPGTASVIVYTAVSYMEVRCGHWKQMMNWQSKWR